MTLAHTLTVAASGTSTSTYIHPVIETSPYDVWCDQKATFATYLGSPVLQTGTPIAYDEDNREFTFTADYLNIGSHAITLTTENAY